MRITKTIESKIKATLDNVKSVKAIYGYPEEKITTYPAVIYLADSFENSFESVTENFRIERYRLWLTIHGSQKELKDIFETILPNAKDDIISQFDSEWNGGTLDGHRVWLVINSGKPSIQIMQNGLEVSLEFELLIKVLTNN